MEISSSIPRNRETENPPKSAHPLNRTIVADADKVQFEGEEEEEEAGRNKRRLTECSSLSLLHFV